MQLHKRLDYGFSGYHVPSIPKAARSARRKGPIQKKGEDDRMHAFDLLASIAGKLLLEGENSPNAANTSDRIGHSVCACDADEKKENDEGVSVKSCPCDQGSSGIISLAPAPGSRDQHKHCSFKEKIGSPHDDCSALAPVITPSKCLEKGRSLEKAVGNDDKSEFSSHPTKLEGFSSGITESCLPKLEEHFKEQVLSQPVNHKEVSFGTETDSRNSEDPHLSNSKPTIVLTSDIAKASLDKGHCPHGAFSPCRDNVKVVCRDDDENSSHCNQPSSTMKTTRSTACIGDRRLRKLLSSKYWKVAPKPKDGDLSDTEMQPVYHHRKNGYKRQRSQRIYPFKKRKYFHCSSVPHSDDCKPVYKSPEKATDATASRFGAMEHAANGTSSSVTGQNMSFHSGEPHVKVRIKSIRVPELFIEVPETATIGSLKRTVTEAVTTLLGGGLHVGVLLQGKKIRDDNKTLLQSGICRNNKVDALGFTLDLKPLQAYPAVCSEDHSLLLSSDVSEPLSKCPPAQSIIHHDTSHALNDHPVPSVGNLIESDHDSAPSPTEISTEKSTVDSRALVTVPEGTPEALAVVPAQRKSKPSEMAQRRIRRPFSVSEVEALVQAVERLGTGRWRDVKLRAFDNVKHRTYVDLKDKWKTLVHTARISPQQRRGEPVPQELLDRVLTAHAFWSQQGKQHQLKQQ